MALQIRKTQIFQKYRKGLRQYPFSIIDMFEETAGSADKMIAQGMIPDLPEMLYWQSLYAAGQADEHEQMELNIDPMIDPPFIYDGSLGTGMYTAW
jgi:hypothetical protein